MEYNLVSESTSRELVEAVNSQIAEGWIPLGGVSVAGVFSSRHNEREDYTEHETEWVYAQSMTRE